LSVLYSSAAKKVRLTIHECHIEDHYLANKR